MCSDGGDGSGSDSGDLGGDVGDLDSGDTGDLSSGDVGELGSESLDDLSGSGLSDFGDSHDAVDTAESMQASNELVDTVETPEPVQESTKQADTIETTEPVQVANGKAENVENIESKQEINEQKDYEEFKSEYIAALKERSEFPDTIKEIDKETWKKVSREKYSENHNEFYQKGGKDKAINDWEKQSGEKWPTYTKDVPTKDGASIARYKGDKYDAHHIRALDYGGKNTAENITPLHCQKHTIGPDGIHLSKEYKSLKGASK